MQSNRKKYQYLVLPLNPANQQKDWKKKSWKKKAQARRESIEKVDQFRSRQRMSGQKQAMETALQRKKNAVFVMTGRQRSFKTVHVLCCEVEQMWLLWPLDLPSVLFECWGGETLLSVPIVKIIEKKWIKIQSCLSLSAAVQYFFIYNYHFKNIILIKIL